MSKKSKKIADIETLADLPGKDVAYKIWLAGVGAYGRAYDETKQGVDKMNHDATEFFETLVKRGEEIETEVRDRLSTNDRVSKSRERLTKAFVDASAFQDKQREKFEARMERMRSVLGFPRQDDDQVAELSAKIDALTSQIAALTPAVEASVAAADGVAESAASRVARLKSGIDEVEQAVAPKAKRSTAKKKTTTKKAAPKK